MRKFKFSPVFSLAFSRIEESKYIECYLSRPTRFISSARRESFLTGTRGIVGVIFDNVHLGLLYVIGVVLMDEENSCETKMSQFMQL